MGDERKMLRVVGLRVENFMRVEAVDISPDPDDPAVLITARNGQGKTSTVNAIWAALGGKERVPGDPVRHGAEKAEIELDLGDIVVKRTFTTEPVIDADGNETGERRYKDSHLTVRPKAEDGKPTAKFDSPQTLLDSLVGRFTLDPLAFAGLPAKEQRDVLLDACGLRDQLEALDSKHAEAYDERREVNRRVKDLDGELSGYADLPDELPATVDVKALLEQQRALQSQRESWQARQRSVQDAQGRARETHSYMEGCEKEVRDLEAMLVRAREKVESAKVSAERAKCAADTAVAEFEGMECPSGHELEAEIAAANESNSKVAAVAERIRARDAARKQRLDKAKAAALFSHAMETIDAQKLQLVADADLPVPGLGFTEDGVTLDEGDGRGPVPFDQVADSRRLHVSMLVAMASDPELRVLRMDRGEQLDDENLELVRRDAAERGFQVWITQVARRPSDEVGIVIRDGRVAEMESEEASDETTG